MKPQVNNINCTTCKNNCCGSIPDLVPVLMPDEEGAYIPKEKHDTPYGPLWTIKKKANGTCIYHDGFSNRCEIYSNRPFECRIYPFLLDFSGKEIKLKLDMRYCPNKTMAIIPEIDMSLPKDWIKAYETLSPKFNGMP